MANDYTEIEYKLPKLDENNAGGILRLLNLYCIGFTKVLYLLHDRKITLHGKPIYQHELKRKVNMVEKEFSTLLYAFEEYNQKNEGEDDLLGKCSDNITNLLQVISLCDTEQIGMLAYLGNLAITDKARFNTLTIGILGSPLLKKVS